MELLEGELGASTEVVLTINLPRVIRMDAALQADDLLLSIPDVWVPTALYKKAAVILKSSDPMQFVKASTTPGAEEGLITYHVLSTSQNKYSTLTDDLVRDYNAMLRGLKPAFTAGNFKKCAAIMRAVHKIETCEHGDRRVCPNNVNPFNLLCNCKTFKRLGVCSHCLVVTHLVNAAKPVAEQKARLDVLKMLTSTDENDKAMLGSEKQTAKGRKGKAALQPAKTVAVGRFASKKTKSKTERREEKRAADKAAKKSQKDAAAALRAAAKEIARAAAGKKKKSSPPSKKGAAAKKKKAVSPHSKSSSPPVVGRPGTSTGEELDSEEEDRPLDERQQRTPAAGGDSSDEDMPLAEMLRRCS